LGVWTAFIDGRGREVGLKLFFDKELRGEIIKKLDDGIWEIRFNKSGKKLDEFIFKLGQMPLPPYIRQEKYKKENKDWYQTVYAKHLGSVAAPTAGLHFTKRLLQKLKKKGVQIEYITLHVGMGTFLPVKMENILKHKMHSELADIDKKTAERLNKAKKEGRKIIAVGTTTARTLEAFAKSYGVSHGSKDVNIFIYPPYKFKFIDALITNFHLPKSTLLMMVSAFLSEGDSKGIKIAKILYQEAIKKKYAFYSYGDAMMITQITQKRLTQITQKRLTQKTQHR
ncbi:tRNA preQ1(34) S-adenosylmethionine ribosyltransferase-isomerase QueA, partial [Patescibacteria group bacterium]|nr:tRNA preQ1(34) S-adenosylmethionine ribosyltransferase-isomerase QueA [Patescibacteria group bacterium]